MAVKCFWETYWEFGRDFSKAQFHRKGIKCCYMWVTSTTLLWGFSGEFEQALLPWPGPKRDSLCWVLEARFGRGPVPLLVGRGPSASRLVLTGRPWSLSFSWRASNWCRAGLALVLLWDRKEAIEGQPWEL